MFVTGTTLKELLKRKLPFGMVISFGHKMCNHVLKIAEKDEERELYDLRKLFV